MKLMNNQRSTDESIELSTIKVPQIKICGLTQLEETAYLIENQIEFAGVVMFVPKSRRNTTPQTAVKLVSALSGSSKTVAVTISPTVEQVKQIEEIGFDYLQIHGQMSPEVYQTCTIPILRAINITEASYQTQDYSALADRTLAYDKVAGILFDASIPGSGETFDWKQIGEIDRHGKLFILAGGLNVDNIKIAIDCVRPDIVDVSSGVEYTDAQKTGKSNDKIKSFVTAVRN